MIVLTRKYRFAASHRLHSPALSDEENRALYDKCNYPHGHGHNYELEISVRGRPDPATGRVAPLGQLDRLVHDEVLAVVDRANLNEDVPGLANAVPTTENLAIEIQHLLERRWPSDFPKLDRIRIQETRRNSFQLNLEGSGAVSRAQEKTI
jgi:6-pyruvoyltetrahydropterin/6-carboxytetrahydropterin synthase